MVNVIEADVAGKPLQNRRKRIVSTALRRGRRKIPLVVRLPIHVVELVLNVEYPESSGSPDHHNYQLKQQIPFPTERETHRKREGHDEEVGHPNRTTLSSAGV